MSMQRVISELDMLRRRSRVLLLMQRIAVLLAWVFGTALVLIGIDFVLRMPGVMRLVILITAIGVFAYAVQRYVLSAVRFHPTLTQLALRVERALPTLAGRLASSVEFAAAGIDEHNAMAARSVRDVDARMAGESAASIIRPKQTLRDLGIFLAVAFVVVTFVVLNPAAAQTGVARIVWPLGSAQWPNRTGVESLMHEQVPEGMVHPRGQTLPLRARVTRGGYAQRVDARYRLTVDGQQQSWQNVVLTQQGNTPIHERLIDTNAEAVEVYFSTADDRTESDVITIVPPPAITRASVRITPPAYAVEHVAPFEAQLGPGTDSRAVTERPSLTGSNVTLTLQLNKPVPTPADQSEIRTMLGWDDAALPTFDVDASRQRWTLNWSLKGSRDLFIELADEYGLTNVEPISYRIEAVADHPPSVTITEPQADQAVLASANVPLVGEAQDDVALSQLAIEVRKHDDSDDELLWVQRESVTGMSARLQAKLDLALLDVSEGDVLVINAVAKDVYDLDGQAHEPVVSPTRRLRIISELDFATQLRRQLGVVRQNAMRIESLQSELQDSIAESGVQPGIERAQAQLSERIAAQREAVEQLQQQMQANRLEDEQLASLMLQSSDLLDFAGRAANDAVEQIAQHSAGELDEQQPILDAQQEVREELTDLIELLDRDEDTWVITRQLESLLAEQAQLAEETSQLHDRTIGQSLEEMSGDDASELERIARAQRDLRDEARQLVEDLRRRADAMQDADPRAASAMRGAADTAEQRELDRDLEAAADRTQQNQLRSAQAGQQGASQTMQRMLQDIEDTRRAEVEQLLRQLASLKESIDRLIFVQENELSALDRAKHSGDYSGRDRAMIRLNQNTQSVASEARAAGQQTRRIARTLDRAADAQGAAIVGLRADPIDHDAAEQAEERSLELLNEARVLAEELEQQAQEEEIRRRREELIAAYRAFLERQTTLRAATLDLAEHEQLNRRQLVEARRLGTQQDDIRVGLDDLQRDVSDILESPMFSHVHRRIDTWSQRISGELNQGTITIDTTDRQDMIAQRLGRLIEALEESMQPPDEFAQDGDGGGEGEGGSDEEQALIPPVTELRLLRGLQEEIYNQTRQLDSRADLTEVQRRDRMRDLGDLQRDLLHMGQQMLENLQ